MEERWHVRHSNEPHAIRDRRIWDICGSTQVEPDGWRSPTSAEFGRSSSRCIASFVSVCTFEDHTEGRRETPTVAMFDTRARLQTCVQSLGIHVAANGDTALLLPAIIGQGIALHCMVVAGLLSPLHFSGETISSRFLHMTNRR